MAATALADGALPAALLDDLALGLAATPAPHVVAALAEADPLRLDLPALPGLQATAPETLRALGALYLAARLEDMGVLVAVEWLVRERAALRIPAASAQRLEDIARRRPQELPREQRALLYARLFGSGPGVGADPGRADARFEPLLAALCSALVTCGARPAGTADRDHAAVAAAARDLAISTSSSAGGGVVLAVPRVNDQLRRGIELLSDPGIGALVGGRWFWATLQAMLGASAPDLRRLLDVGRNGQRVLRWLADAVPALAQPAGIGPAIAPDAVTSAAAWMQACGLPLPARREGWA